ncbi:MAG: cell division ATP-binding protein FtsE [Bacillota bacterium]|nr:cell division ATP-binding protein FtsE [Bacillota bacterium]
MITLIGVSKVYRPRRVALLDVNVHIGKGEFVFLTGASGAGKSTFLRLLYREQTPTSGQVIVLGQDVARIPMRKVPYLRRQIGVVFQDYKLLSDKTVWDNVAFPLLVTEHPPREIARRVPAVLEQVGLLGYEKNRAGELSGGEQQRVALARSIVLNPAILLADEPTGNLDAGTARIIADLIQDIHRRGSTVVMATHSDWIVNRLRQRVIHLRHGRIVADEYPGRYVHEA